MEGCGTGETEHFNGPLRLRRTLGALLLLASPGPPAAREARRGEWRCGARAKWVPSAGRAQGARRRSRVGTTAHMAERIGVAAAGSSATSTGASSTASLPVLLALAQL